MLRRIKEKGLKIAFNLSMQQTKDEKILEEEELNIFSRNYGLTSHSIVLSLYAHLGTQIWIVDHSGMN